LACNLPGVRLRDGACYCRWQPRRLTHLPLSLSIPAPQTGTDSSVGLSSRRRQIEPRRRHSAPGRFPISARGRSGRRGQGEPGRLA
jgi:hypothetical protein